MYDLIHGQNYLKSKCETFLVLATLLPSHQMISIMHEEHSSKQCLMRISISFSPTREILLSEHISGISTEMAI